MAPLDFSTGTAVEYKQLGKCGLRVSVPILGAMSFGDSRWQKWVIGEDEVCLWMRIELFSSIEYTLNVDAGVYFVESCLR